MRRLKLYYNNGNSKVYIKTFGDGTNVTEALHEAMEWCKENCTDVGLMIYYYNGHKVWLEQCE